MMGKNLLAILLIIVFLGSVSWAFPAFGPGDLGFGPPPRRAPSAEEMMKKITKDLGLTPEQEGKILADVKKVEAEAKTLHEQNKERFDSIEKELLKETPHREMILGSIKKINENNTQIQIGRIDQIIRMRQELTPEQRAKLDKIMKERKERSEKRHEKFRQKRPNK